MFGIKFDLDWMIDKLKPDFNKNNKNDVRELQDALTKLSVDFQHAVDTLDYKTILVYLTDITESLQKIAFLIDQIKNAVTTEEVKAAVIACQSAASALGVLLKSFAETHKVALLKDSSGDIS